MAICHSHKTSRAVISTVRVTKTQTDRSSPRPSQVTRPPVSLYLSHTDAKPPILPYPQPFQAKWRCSLISAKLLAYLLKKSSVGSTPIVTRSFNYAAIDPGASVGVRGHLRPVGVKLSSGRRFEQWILKLTVSLTSVHLHAAALPMLITRCSVLYILHPVAPLYIRLSS